MCVLRVMSMLCLSLSRDDAEREEVQQISRWRRWLYSTLLLLNTPLLMVAVGVVTLPAFSMLALLLGLVKVHVYTCRFTSHSQISHATGHFNSTVLNSTLISCQHTTCTCTSLHLMMQAKGDYDYT